MPKMVLVHHKFGETSRVHSRSRQRLVIGGALHHSTSTRACACLKCQYCCRHSSTTARPSGDLIARLLPTRCVTHTPVARILPARPHNPSTDDEVGSSVMMSCADVSISCVFLSSSILQSSPDAASPSSEEVSSNEPTGGSALPPLALPTHTTSFRIS